MKKNRYFSARKFKLLILMDVEKSLMDVKQSFKDLAHENFNGLNFRAEMYQFF